MTHQMQTMFATAEGEERFVDKVRRQIEGGYLDSAEVMLMSELAALNRDLAHQCMELKRSDVRLEGWPELLDALAQFEGEDITGIAIGMGNELDLAFEKGQLHVPYITLGIYSDGGYAFSGASRKDLLDQLAGDVPAWAGHEEDIEVYMEVTGLEALNTALIHHKQRHFLRDRRTAEAPEGYVEYVLACWLRALRFHQAVGAELARHGLPGRIPVISGTFDMQPAVASVHYPEKTIETAAPVADLGSLITKAAPKRPVEIVELEPRNIRAQIAANNDSEPEAKKVGLLGRMFGR
ncbi:MAG TPA: hypothetical protein VLA37_02640 [Sphingomonadaceae bacterium]|nr:hypothetical protein [Sphingomonadaceae bacterium]